MGDPDQAEFDKYGPDLRLSVVGQVRGSVDGAPLVINSRKTRALLGYLALHDPPSESRERLVGLLWSESDEEKGRASCRQTLRELRAACEEVGYSGLHADRLSVGLESRSLKVDILEAMIAAAGGEAHAVLESAEPPQDAILEGLDDLDPAFRIWLLAKRQTIRERLCRDLEAALENPNLTRDSRRGVAAALVNIDPTHEKAVRVLMRGYAEAGDIAGAIRIYNNLWRLLGDDYDMEPSPETIELLAQIKTGLVNSEPSSAARRPGRNGVAASPIQIAPVQSEPVIALWLDAIRINGLHADHNYLVQGFRHQLVSCLVRFREWLVFDQAGSPVTAPAERYARNNYLVETTAQPSPNGVGLALTLKDLATGRFVWSENIDLSLDSWFEAQRRVVRRVATALNVHLSSDRLKNLAVQPNISMAAYDRWLRGFYLQQTHDAKKCAEAAMIFDETIRDAPDFALGYCTKAMLDNGRTIMFPGSFRDMERHERNIALARHAVEIDPIDARTHLCLAWSNMLLHRPDDGLAHANLAHELNENDPWTAVSAANIMALCGLSDRARQIVEQASELNPLPSPVHLAYRASLYFNIGDYKKCIESGEHAGRGYPGSQAIRAAAFGKIGDTAKAREELRRFIEFIRSNWFGEIEPTEWMIMKWFLHTHPYASSELWEHLRDGLRRAGAPVETMRFREW